jgi:hypothetical protein
LLLRDVDFVKLKVSLEIQVTDLGPIPPRPAPLAVCPVSKSLVEHPLFCKEGRIVVVIHGLALDAETLAGAVPVPLTAYLR